MWKSESLSTKFPDRDRDWRCVPHWSRWLRWLRSGRLMTNGQKLRGGPDLHRVTGVGALMLPVLKAEESAQLSVVVWQQWAFVPALREWVLSWQVWCA